jgi:RHS repeat-associated protein
MPLADWRNTVLRFLTRTVHNVGRYSLPLLLGVPLAASAQLINVADDTSTPIPGVGHDYIHMLSETVNPANGSVSLRIQLPTPTGRGLNFPFALTYDSGKVHHFMSSKTGYGGWVGDFSASTGGWGNTMPLLSYQTWNINIPGFEGEPTDYYCYYASGYMFQDFSGSQHALGLAVVDNDAPSGNSANCRNLAITTKSRYGAETVALGYDSGVIASYPSSDCGVVPGSYPHCNYASPPVTITDLSGNVFTFSGGNSIALPSAGNTGYYWPNSIEDRNGNEITISDPTSYAATVIDTLGNPVVAFGSSGAVYSNVSPSYTVGGLVYNVAYTTTAANYTIPTLQVGSVPSVDVPCVLGPNVSEGSGEGQASPQTVIHSITLPNLQAYTFYYGADNPNPGYANPYGLLSEIDYPDGGWVRYTWKLSDTYAELTTFDAALKNGLPAGQGDLNACNYQYQIPVVATRTIGYGSESAAAQTQKFTYNTTWNSNSLTWTGKATTVSTTDNILGESAQTIYNYVDCECSALEPPDFPYTSAAQIPVEQSVKYYDWGNITTPMLTETKAWVSTSILNCVFDTPSTNQSTGHFYTYSYDRVSDDKEYDYGQLAASTCSGPLVTAPNSPVPAREVSTPMQGFTNPLLNRESPPFGLPQEEVIYDHGSAIEETDYGYDAIANGTTLFPVSATNHDETNFGVSAVGNRGNLTSSTKKCLVGCTVDATTTFTYDETGQVHTMTDPCAGGVCSDIAGTNHTTTYSFTDNPTSGNPSGNSNAYLTQITYPKVNGVTAYKSFGYHYGFGDLISAADENQKTTLYKYGTKPSKCASQDELDRLSEVDYPDGGATEYCYDDAAASVTTYELLSVSTWKTSVAARDGMGHTIETSITSDPYGTDTVNTSYDGEGRVYTKTNPQRSTPLSTDGTTTYYYDALGRQIEESEPDGHPLQWCYNGLASSVAVGNCNPQRGSVTTGIWVDSTDENGTDWQHTSDSFGRINVVMEPNGLTQSPTMETDYNYDALNNLLSVVQNGVSGTDTPLAARNFSYDSLSRLISAFNPESGTITYSYDANGNLITKSSPAQNGASGIQTIGYCYDALNRMTYKFYTGSYLCTSPSGYAAAYAYDGAVLPGSLVTSPPPVSFSNATGHLTDEQQFSGGAVITERIPFQYDPMGRLLNEDQVPYGPSSSQYNYQYTYDLAGDLTNTVNNSPGGIGTGYTYDTAARLNTVTSNLTSSGSTTYPSPLYQVNSYGPVGLTSATYGITGTNAGIFNRFRYYNNRARLMNDEVYPLTDAFGTASVTISGTENLCASGSGGSCVAETGTVSITAGTLTETTTYGATSTAQSVGAALTADINQSGSEGSFGVTAALGTSGPGCNSGLTTATPSVPCSVITLTAVEFGIYGNLPLTAIDTYANGSGPSFSAVASGTALTGGTGTPQGGPAYETTLTYRPNGNVAIATDPFEGYWIYGYDTLNRLTSGSFESYEGTGVVTPSGTFAYQCWAYDSFGNRTNELETNSGCPSTLTNGTSTHWMAYANHNNRVTSSDTEESYDSAGNVIQDNLNNYAYDMEGRLCAVENRESTSATQYVYDAEGNRVAKGSLSGTFPSGTPCAAPTSANGFALTAMYLRGNGGDQDTELDSNLAWHTNVYADGGLLATYSGVNNGSGTAPSLSFSFSDWQGTKRLQTTATGQVSLWWSSDPFGDYLHASGSGSDATEQHFTGKERDTESGNDYFGARYYGSSIGRFLSPDPLLNSGRPDNPQSWNRYAYVLNNPLIVTDPTGLYNLINNCASEDKGCNKTFAYDAKNLKDAISTLTSAVNGLKDGDQKTALQASLKALGTENDGNNVGVQFGKNADGAAGITTLSVDSAGKLNFTITLDPSKNQWSPVQGAYNMAINAAHEGTHVADESDPRFADNATTLSLFSVEYRGYRTSAYAASALGQPSVSYGKYPIWNGSWGAVDRNLTNYITSFRGKNGQPDHPETTPHDPWSQKQ